MPGIDRWLHTNDVMARWECEADEIEYFIKNVLTDLCVNSPPAESFLLRFYRRWIQDYEGKFTMARIMKLMVRDCEALRSSCDRILRCGFDRVTVARGEVLESRGREAFENAFRC